MAVSQSLTLTQTGQSVANNTSTVRILWKSTQSGQSYNNYTRTAKYYISINGGAEVEYSITYNLPKASTKTILDTTITVPHNADGTGSVSVRTWMDTRISAGVVEKTAALKLDTIPRASSLTASNGTLGTEQTLTIKRAVSTFKHRLTYKCGDVVDYIAGSATTFTTGTSIEWTPPIGLAAENTKGTSVQVVFTLYTYAADGTHIGTTQKTITCAIPTSVKPSCTISVEDTAGLIEKYDAAVQGLSKLKITVKATTSQGAPISAYSISANGAKYNTNPATTEALTTAGTNKISATVKDTRGRSGSNSANVVVLPYVAPVVSLLTVHRCDEDGTDNDQGEYVKVIISGTVSGLNNQNTANYKLRYKKTNEATYTEETLTAIGNVYSVVNHIHVFQADGNSSFDVEVVLTDNHNTYARATSVSTAFTMLNWHKSGTGMGVGKVSELENAVEFGLPIYDQDDGLIVGIPALINLFLPVGSVVIRYDTKNPATLYPGTTWVQITARVLRAGSAGSIGAEGGLADGSARTYIDVAVWRRTA